MALYSWMRINLITLFWSPNNHRLTFNLGSLCDKYCPVKVKRLYKTNISATPAHFTVTFQFIYSIKHESKHYVTTINHHWTPTVSVVDTCSILLLGPLKSLIIYIFSFWFDFSPDFFLFKYTRLSFVVVTLFCQRKW